MLGTSQVVGCGEAVSTFQVLLHPFLFIFSLNLRLIFIVELSEYEGDSSEVKIIPWLPTLAALPAGNRWIYSYYSIEYDA